MNKSILSIILIQCCCILTMTAQTVFRGKVVDEAGNPITEAVAFRLAEHAAILGTSVADSVGTIAFDEVFFDSQKETVRVTAFGYQDVSLTANPEAAIVLKPLAVGLEEIVVKGEAQVVQRSDGLTFKVANTGLVKASNNALDLVKMTPLIKEDENRKLSVLGKNSFVLYINGRKTNLSDDAISSYLQSLPPENVIDIEVITNPGVTESKFHATAHTINSLQKAKLLPQASAADVAQYGYESMMQGKTLAVHKFGNRFNIFASRFLPRCIVTKLAASATTEKNNHPKG